MQELRPNRHASKWLTKKLVTVKVVDQEYKLLGQIHFQKELYARADVWYSAWFSPTDNLTRRAPRLDAANTRELGHTVGEIIAKVLNYGENGVLDPDEPAE